MPAPTLRLPLVALLTALTLPGCGGPGAAERRPAPSLSDAELAAATVRLQMRAVARGDGPAACGLFSRKALEQVEARVGRRVGDIGCATAVEQGASGLSAGTRAALRRPAITRVAVHGDRATVSVQLPAGLVALAGERGEHDLKLALRRTGGSWRVAGVPR